MAVVEPSTSVLMGSSIPPGRRQSSIFLSSLQRPLPPPKLDLSAISLRMTAEEATSLFSGLASPVTLAPRSARPSTANDLPPDLMAFASGSSDEAVNRSLDIDLTVPDDSNTVTDISAGTNGVDMILDSTLGSSADKPIELDLDMDIEMSMTDLFGDTVESTTNETMEGLFSPPTTTPDLTIPGTAVDGKTAMKEEAMGMEMLDALSAVGGTSENQVLFGSLGANSQHNIDPGPINSSVPTGTSPSAIPPSPASLLASFEAASHIHPADTLSSTHQNVSPDTPFDFDLSTLGAGMFSSPPPQELNLEDLFNMGGQGDVDVVVHDPRQDAIG